MSKLDFFLANNIHTLEEFPPDPDDGDDSLFFEKQYGAVDALIKFFLEGDENERAKILSVTKNCVNTFHSYAHWMAVCSVRKNNPLLIFKGLVALAIENLRNDFRDTLVIISLLANSARKLQGTEVIQFQSAKTISSKQFGEFLSDYLSRTTWNRTIAIMGFTESGSGECFNYVQNTDIPI
ncbi:MAG: hypothetical protein R3B84_12010 [Zavarzinella sp.]